MSTNPPKAPDVVKVSILGSDSIVLGFHLSDYIITDILTVAPSSTYVIITDTNIAPLYLPALIDHFNARFAENSDNNVKPPRLLTYVIPPGEVSKSRETKGQIEDYLLANTCTRDTCILALGGGVIGDLVGFVAATFMRGVPFVQIPSTLLAMVDSSIGGKTAIDTPHGKNLIGAFWQPKRIFIDLAFLQTLPEREFVNGMAEVIKTAAIWNVNDFVLLENGVDSIREAVLTKSATKPHQGRTLATRTVGQLLLLEVILASVRVKAHVVTHDERETGLRGLLNFGHSIGHAIEGIATPQVLHGECVAIGMIKEAEIARNLGYLNGVAVGRLLKVLQAYGLPVSLDDKRVKQLLGDKYCHVDAMMEIMKIDKKNRGDKKRVVMLSAIGKTLEERATFIADDVIRKILSPEMVVLPVTESPKGPTRNVTMSTPGSKSISNRALVLAALGTGTCRLKGLLHSDDTQYMLEALQKLGAAQFAWEDNGETLVVTGGGGNLRVPDTEIYVGNAGTASRFLTTVLTLVPTAEGSKRNATVLTGNARMQQRPIDDLLTALKANGAQIKSLNNEGFLPIAVTPIGGLKGGEINLSASISSQYVSSILMCAPYAQESVTLHLTGDEIISLPYIDLTIAMMESFGATIERLPQNTYRIARSTYKNPDVYFVESDASSATYPLAIAAITGTTCTISNIGASSLQGDAAFAVNVLRPMGCTVTQTATSTTVTGPPIGQLRPLPLVDMEKMTDAFMTAAVLAAVTSNPDGNENITRITGIANQRVKECNRIAAMVHELAKFGVTASELPKGIQIHGMAIQSLKAPAQGVHTYDDHRIAMSFSVLSTVVTNGTIIKDKKCVEKTWPTWWDDLEHRLGVQLRGIDLGPLHGDHEVIGDSKPAASGDSNATIVVIGMRGAGKTTMGQFAARALGLRFIDLDAHLEGELKTTIFDFINTWGWDRFRARESEFITSVLAPSSPFATGHVLACGGGIVETPSNRQRLKQYVQAGGKIIHLVRDFDHVERYLNKDKTRPMYGEDMRLVWNRRESWYRQCCNFEFVAYVESSGLDEEIAIDQWKLVERDLKRFLDFVVTEKKINDISQTASKPTTFVALTYPDIRAGVKELEAITEGADAVELRVDLLKAPEQEGPIPPLAYIGEQLAILRRYTSIPIVFTVRSKDQGGAFPANAESELFDLLSWGEKWGCEYVDVEIAWSSKMITELVAHKGNSKIIASWHDVRVETPWNGSLIVDKYKLAERYGDIIKLIGSAQSFESNLALEIFRTARKTSQIKPLIAMNMGSQGQLSRVLNDFLTPTTHPALPNKAAPGQLSLAEIHMARHLLGLLPAKTFYLFGTPIQHSFSPTLHNTGFKMLGLPHHYSLFQCSAIEYAEDIIRDPDFGGASVTIPHKVAVMKYMDEITVAARIIGAVNTVIVENASEADRSSTKRRLIGDNTDYLGIMNTIKPHIGTDVHQEALVVGAGGTSRAALYALHMLGVPTIYLYNRTTSKASSLIKEFEAHFSITLLETLEDAKVKPTIVVSTIPADNDIKWPESLFSGVSSGIACDLPYLPRRTSLLKAAESKGWKTVEGIQVLIEQGFWQFEKWTGKRAPKGKISSEVLAKIGL
ncbi:EPSP synthase-domain-containing protein [Jimgerdemannia flammicorona]|uniref:Pentafunctional AROM polypeptide n=1 Tax=Jimgerdemannia flammicorona TaxID=994334 RepID=A0A433Q8H2_9FUNG|nr:EPSP synthase-domain-containing protein [Jimgerdemannia flammicorona]